MAAQPAPGHENAAAGDGQTSGFHRFSELPLFAASGQARDALACPLLAHAWSAAIVRFWETGLAAGSIDPAKPLYLLDPAPGQGRLAWLLLGALRQRLAVAGPDIQPCYVACSGNADQLDYLATHPYFREYTEAGWFDTACWDAGKLDLRARRITLLRTDNPVVVPGLEWLQTLPSELAGVHRGRPMEGRAALTAPQEPEHAYRLDYQWQPLDETDPLLQPLWAHYLPRFAEVPVLWPAAACKALDALARLSSGRYLLLAADAGICSDRELRLGALMPPAEWRPGQAPLPVNYHALSLYQRQHGACTWDRKLRDDGAVMHAALRDDSCAMTESAFGAIIACLEHAHPDDGKLLVPADAAPATLTLLRLSHYDPRVLQAGIESMLEQAPALNDTARKEWQSALARTWSNYLPCAAPDPFYHETGLLAAQLGHWGLAKECFRLGLALYGDDATDLHHLALCEAATGAVDEALSLVSRALEVEPDNPHCRALHARLAERLQRRQAARWYHPDAARNGELTLEPLGAEHAESLLHQYRDPQIGEMTALAELNTPDEARDWIAEQAGEAGRITCAVMHAHWGFVGVASMRCAADAGYFYFWTGTDFQGRGFGQQAAALLFEQAARNGIVHLFTSAYADNGRSRKALGQLGFAELNLRAQAPDDGLIFYYLRPRTPAAPAKPTALIRELCHAIGSPIVFTED